MIDDTKVHLFIRKSSLLSAQEREEIESRIKEDHPFSEYVNRVKQFYEEMKEIEEDPELRKKIESTASKFAEELSGSNTNILRLKPHRFTSENEKHIMKLAAMQTSSVKNEFKYVNTYVSAQKYVMIRVLKNPALNVYNLYLICEDMSLVENAVINFDKMRKDFVADKGGVIRLKTDYLRGESDIIVFLPLARFELNRGAIEAGKGRMKSLDYKIADGKLNLKFSRKDRLTHKSLKVAVIVNDKSEEAMTRGLSSEFECSLELTEKNLTNIKIILLENI